MIINPHKEHYRVCRTQYLRQDADDDGASQYTERKCFSNKCQVHSVSHLQPQSYGKFILLKEGVGFVDLKMLQEQTCHKKSDYR